MQNKTTKATKPTLIDWVHAGLCPGVIVGFALGCIVEFTQPVPIIAMMFLAFGGIAATFMAFFVAHSMECKQCEELRKQLSEGKENEKG